MAVVEPLQNLIVDDIITQLRGVTGSGSKSALLGSDDVAISLAPREPLSLQDEPQNHGECVVYDASDAPADGEAAQTQIRELSVMVELYASEEKDVSIRRLLRRAWAQAVQVVCADFGQRVDGVNKIEAGEVLIIPEPNANAARAFCTFIVTLEHLANNPTAAR